MRERKITGKKDVLAEAHDAGRPAAQTHQPQLLHGVGSLSQPAARAGHHVFLVPGGGCPWTVGHGDAVDQEALVRRKMDSELCGLRCEVQKANIVH